MYKKIIEFSVAVSENMVNCSCVQVPSTGTVRYASKGLGSEVVSSVARSSVVSLRRELSKQRMFLGLKHWLKQISSILTHSGMLVTDGIVSYVSVEFLFGIHGGILESISSLAGVVAGILGMGGGLFIVAHFRIEWEFARWEYGVAQNRLRDHFGFLIDMRLLLDDILSGAMGNIPSRFEKLLKYHSPATLLGTLYEIGRFSQQNDLRSLFADIDRYISTRRGIINYLNSLTQIVIAEETVVTKPPVYHDGRAYGLQEGLELMGSVLEEGESYVRQIYGYDQALLTSEPVTALRQLFFWERFAILSQVQDDMLVNFLIKAQVLVPVECLTQVHGGK